VTGNILHGVGASDGLDDLQFINLDVHHHGMTPDGVRRCDGQDPGECHGTYFNNCTNVVFRCGQIHHNEGMGIHNGNSGQIVDGVTFYHNGTHGMIFRYGDYNQVLNSTFLDNPTSGIWVASGQHNRLIGNRFSGNGTPILFDRAEATAEVQNGDGAPASCGTAGGPPPPVAGKLPPPTNFRIGRK
jgi:hypothetical protein